MIKQFAPCVKKYWWAALLSPLTVIIEVLLEVRIPMLMSQIVDTGITNQDLQYVVNMGVQMVAFALCSLAAGALSAWFASIAGMGLGAGLRQGMFDRVQDFAFSNVDRFSTASLVTRLTTDVNRVQMTFMMLIRVCVRARDARERNGARLAAQRGAGHGFPHCNPRAGRDVGADCNASLSTFSGNVGKI